MNHRNAGRQLSQLLFLVLTTVTLVNNQTSLAQSMGYIPEMEVGLSLPAVSGSISTGKSLLIAGSGVDIDFPRRIAQGIEATEKPARFGSRGVRDVQNYRKYSPSVALIITDTGIGSGFVVSNDGLILTNYHVIDAAKSVTVVFKPSIEGAAPTKTDAVSASVVRVDQKSDLALVQVRQKPASATPISLGSISSVAVGADVFAIGHPTGESWTFTKGVVSQLRRDYQWRTESGLDHRATVIQTQTPINPGNSGGPLIDSETGVLVGVNSFKSEGEGLNYAVSVEDVRHILNSKQSRYIKKTGSSRESSTKSKTCAPKTLSSGRSKSGDANLDLIDLDCDGTADAVIETPDDQTRGISLQIDTDKNGQIDVIVVDNDRDGNADFQLVDTNKDGKADIIGYYRPGESEPYKYEKFNA
jgi:S1-C subfamily serine protease